MNSMPLIQRVERQMSIKTHILGIFLAVMMGACAQSAEPGLPTITVHKSPTCVCCKVWAQHLRNAGFAVEVKNSQNLSPVKQRLGVPATMGSCHTAEVGGYFVEGHVPIEDIKRMLRDRPDAKGIAVPRMPVGSPGMEVPSGEVEPYSVFMTMRDGGTRVFAKHGQPEVKSR